MPAVEFFSHVTGDGTTAVIFFTKASRLYWTTERHVVLINSH